MRSEAPRARFTSALPSPTPARQQVAKPSYPLPIEGRGFGLLFPRPCAWRIAPSVSAARCHLPASGEEPPPKEKWGRPCGRPHSHRRVVFAFAKSLTPGVSMPGPTGPCGQLKVGVAIARRSRRCRFRRGPEQIARTCPSARRFRDRCRRPGPRTAPACPKVLRTPRRQAGKSGLSDIAPSRLQRFGIWSAPGRTFERSASHPSTARHLAVASKRFRNPFFLAGLSAFALEGPIPVSMSEGCLARPIRATAEQASYPPSTGMSVDKSG